MLETAVIYVENIQPFSQENCSC